jgi:Cu(I)/Ag(I) efflux system membrane protein CusA/SilA
VSEVASLGGFGRQYQVNVDPNRLRNYGLSIQRVVDAVRGGNVETGGRLIEFGGTEYMVRGRGYAKSIADFEKHRRVRQARAAPRSGSATSAR